MVKVEYVLEFYLENFQVFEVTVLQLWKFLLKTMYVHGRVIICCYYHGLRVQSFIKI